jgi:predicted peptidase
MSDSAAVIAVEPGKQLPKSLPIRVSDSPAAPTQTIHYLLFTPSSYKADGERWPLLIFLHGLGECGKNQLERVKTHGPPKLVETRPDFPFVVVSPQCRMPKGGLKDVPTAWKAEQLIQLVDHAIENLHIDRERVYVTGLSMGGFGTWRLVSRYPDRFAAAVTICGGGEPEAMAASLERVPVWAFHGALDETVPLVRSEEMVDAVRAAGGDVRLTIYPEVAHDSWTRTYENEDIYDWLLSHKRAAR